MKAALVLERFGRFAKFVDLDGDDAQWRTLRMAETTGRPLGSEAWLDAVEAQTGRPVKSEKRWPKPGRAEE